jgi:hypothetical protein
MSEITDLIVKHSAMRILERSQMVVGSDYSIDDLFRDAREVAEWCLERMKNDSKPRKTVLRYRRR